MGKDAWYCTMHHPDGAFRSKLHLSCPVVRGSVRQRDGGPTSDDGELLLKRCFSVMDQEPSSSRTLVTYKPSTDPVGIRDLASNLLFDLNVSVDMLWLFVCSRVSSIMAKRS